MHCRSLDFLFLAKCGVFWCLFEVVLDGFAHVSGPSCVCVFCFVFFYGGIVFHPVLLSISLPVRNRYMICAVRVAAVLSPAAIGQFFLCICSLISHSSWRFCFSSITALALLLEFCCNESVWVFFFSGWGSIQTCSLASSSGFRKSLTAKSFRKSGLLWRSICYLLAVQSSGALACFSLTVTWGERGLVLTSSLLSRLQGLRIWILEVLQRPWALWFCSWYIVCHGGLCATGFRD